MVCLCLDIVDAICVMVKGKVSSDPSKSVGNFSKSEKSTEKSNPLSASITIPRTCHQGRESKLEPRKDTVDSSFPIVSPTTTTSSTMTNTASTNPSVLSGARRINDRGDAVRNRDGRNSLVYTRSSPSKLSTNLNSKPGAKVVVPYPRPDVKSDNGCKKRMKGKKLIKTRFSHSTPLQDEVSPGNRPPKHAPVSSMPWGKRGPTAPAGTSFLSSSLSSFVKGSEASQALETSSAIKVGRERGGGTHFSYNKVPLTRRHTQSFWEEKKGNSFVSTNTSSFPISSGIPGESANMSFRFSRTEKDKNRSNAGGGKASLDMSDVARDDVHLRGEKRGTHGGRKSSGCVEKNAKENNNDDASRLTQSRSRSKDFVEGGDQRQGRQSILDSAVNPSLFTTKRELSLPSTPPPPSVLISSIPFPLVDTMHEVASPVWTSTIHSSQRWEGDKSPGGNPPPSALHTIRRNHFTSSTTTTSVPTGMGPTYGIMGHHMRTLLQSPTTSGNILQEEEERSSFPSRFLPQSNLSGVLQCQIKSDVAFDSIRGYRNRFVVVDHGHQTLSIYKNDQSLVPLHTYKTDRLRAVTYAAEKQSRFFRVNIRTHIGDRIKLLFETWEERDRWGRVLTEMIDQVDAFHRRHSTIQLIDRLCEAAMRKLGEVEINIRGERFLDNVPNALLQYVPEAVEKALKTIEEVVNRRELGRPPIAYQIELLVMLRNGDGPLFSSIGPVGGARHSLLPIQRISSPTVVVGGGHRGGQGGGPRARQGGGGRGGAKAAGVVVGEGGDGGGVQYDPSSRVVIIQVRMLCPTLPQARLVLVVPSYADVEAIVQSRIYRDPDIERFLDPEENRTPAFLDVGRALWPALEDTTKSTNFTNPAILLSPTSPHVGSDSPGGVEGGGGGDAWGGWPLFSYNKKKKEKSNTTASSMPFTSGTSPLLPQTPIHVHLLQEKEKGKGSPVGSRIRGSTSIVGSRHGSLPGGEGYSVGGPTYTIKGRAGEEGGGGSAAAAPSAATSARVPSAPFISFQWDQRCDQLSREQVKGYAQEFLTPDFFKSVHDSLMLGFRLLSREALEPLLSRPSSPLIQSMEMLVREPAYLLSGIIKGISIAITRTAVTASQPPKLFLAFTPKYREICHLAFLFQAVFMNAMMKEGGAFRTRSGEGSLGGGGGKEGVGSWEGMGEKEEEEEREPSCTNRQWNRKRGGVGNSRGPSSNFLSNKEIPRSPLPFSSSSKKLNLAVGERSREKKLGERAAREHEDHSSPCVTSSLVFSSSVSRMDLVESVSSPLYDLREAVQKGIHQLPPQQQHHHHYHHQRQPYPSSLPPPPLPTAGAAFSLHSPLQNHSLLSEPIPYLNSEEFSMSSMNNYYRCPSLNWSFQPSLSSSTSSVDLRQDPNHDSSRDHHPQPHLREAANSSPWGIQTSWNGFQGESSLATQVWSAGMKALISYYLAAYRDILQRVAAPFEVIINWKELFEVYGRLVRETERRRVSGVRGSGNTRESEFPHFPSLESGMERESEEDRVRGRKRSAGGGRGRNCTGSFYPHARGNSEESTVEGEKGSFFFGGVVESEKCARFHHEIMQGSLTTAVTPSSPALSSLPPLCSPLAVGKRTLWPSLLGVLQDVLEAYYCRLSKFMKYLREEPHPMAALPEYQEEIRNDREDGQGGRGGGTSRAALKSREVKKKMANNPQKGESHLPHQGSLCAFLSLYVRWICVGFSVLAPDQQLGMGEGFAALMPSIRSGVMRDVLLCRWKETWTTSTSFSSSSVIPSGARDLEKGGGGSGGGMGVGGSPSSPMPPSGSGDGISPAAGRSRPLPPNLPVGEGRKAGGGGGAGEPPLPPLLVNASSPASPYAYPSHLRLCSSITGYSSPMGSFGGIERRGGVGGEGGGRRWSAGTVAPGGGNAVAPSSSYSSNELLVTFLLGKLAITPAAPDLGKWCTEFLTKGVEQGSLELLKDRVQKPLRDIFDVKKKRYYKPRTGSHGAGGGKEEKKWGIREGRRGKREEKESPLGRHAHHHHRRGRKGFFSRFGEEEKQEGEANGNESSQRNKRGREGHFPTTSSSIEGEEKDFDMDSSSTSTSFSSTSTSTLTSSSSTSGLGDSSNSTTRSSTRSSSSRDSRTGRDDYDVWGRRSGRRGSGIDGAFAASGKRERDRFAHFGDSVAMIRRDEVSRIPFAQVRNTVYDYQGDDARLKITLEDISTALQSLRSSLPTLSMYLHDAMHILMVNLQQLRVLFVQYTSKESNWLLSGKNTTGGEKSDHPRLSRPPLPSSHAQSPRRLLGNRSHHNHTTTTTNNTSSSFPLGSSTLSLRKAIALLTEYCEYEESSRRVERVCRMYCRVQRLDKLLAFSTTQPFSVLLWHFCALEQYLRTQENEKARGGENPSDAWTMLRKKKEEKKEMETKERKRREKGKSEEPNGDFSHDKGEESGYASRATGVGSVLSERIVGDLNPTPSALLFSSLPHGIPVKEEGEKWEGPTTATATRTTETTAPPSTSPPEGIGKSRDPGSENDQVESGLGSSNLSLLSSLNQSNPPGILDDPGCPHSTSVQTCTRSRASSLWRQDTTLLVVTERPKKTTTSCWCMTGSSHDGGGGGEEEHPDGRGRQGQRGGGGRGYRSEGFLFVRRESSSIVDERHLHERVGKKKRSGKEGEGEKKVEEEGSKGRDSRRLLGLLPRAQEWSSEVRRKIFSPLLLSSKVTSREPVNADPFSSELEHHQVPSFPDFSGVEPSDSEFLELSSVEVGNRRMMEEEDEKKKVEEEDDKEAQLLKRKPFLDTKKKNKKDVSEGTRGATGFTRKEKACTFAEDKEEEEEDGQHPSAMDSVPPSLSSPPLLLHETLGREWNRTLTRNQEALRRAKTTPNKERKVEWGGKTVTEALWGNRDGGGRTRGGDRTEFRAEFSQHGICLSAEKVEALHALYKDCIRPASRVLREYSIFNFPIIADIALNLLLPMEVADARRARRVGLLFGLDRTGKTLISNCLRGLAQPTVATVGMQEQIVSFGRWILVMSELGGRECFRRNWRYYVERAPPMTYLIFLIDAQNRARMRESRQYLWEVLQYFPHIPLLIIFNNFPQYGGSSAGGGFDGFLFKPQEVLEKRFGVPTIREKRWVLVVTCDVTLVHDTNRCIPSSLQYGLEKLTDFLLSTTPPQEIPSMPKDEVSTGEGEGKRGRSGTSLRRE